MYTGLFDKGGRLRPAGSHWSRPEYAETLKILAEEGDEPFYSGRIAEDIVKVVQARGGLLNMQDMESESYPPVLSGRLR
jgi:gamma-glutamyltranspeptidase/glutathione hydrolase